MRTSIALATFLAVGAGAVGASALSGISFKGSDTLYEVTREVIAACPAITNTAFTYIGTGSSVGERAMNSGAQTVAPMSRSIKGVLSGLDTSGGCFSNSYGTPASAEALVVGRDGVSIVGSALTSGAAACDGSLDDCDRTTEPNVGLAFSKTIALTDGSTYTLNGWSDVLRIVYGGADRAARDTLANRDCNSVLRNTIVNTWGNLFENSCAGGTCTQLRHAFRPDDASGTTDTLVSVLGLASINLTSRVSPFCNALLTTDATPAIGRNQPDYSDADPIRRACAGTNVGTGTTTATEQVCSRLGTLGLVLPITPVTHLSPVDAFPTNRCQLGQFKFGYAPRSYPWGYGLCPNGDSVVFTNQCYIPIDAAGNAGCLNSKDNKPSYIFGGNGAVDGVIPTLSDGRAYNLNLYKADGTYQADKRVPARPIQGAFHRIHSTKTMNVPNNVATCREYDATSQIGCLVQASPCSIGYAGREASTYTGVAALKVNAVEPTTACIQNLAYRLTRKLYLSSLMGFGSVNGDELELAKCFANNAITSAAIVGNGFVALPSNSPGGGVFCEDFNEAAFCNAATNVDACADNVGVIPTASTICGNGTVEALEECDLGELNDNYGRCSKTCHLCDGPHCPCDGPHCSW